MNSYEIVESDHGEMLMRDDGFYVHSDIMNLVIELIKQNPRFAKLWLGMAEEYVFLNTDVGEA